MIEINCSSVSFTWCLVSLILEQFLKIISFSIFFLHFFFRMNVIVVVLVSLMYAPIQIESQSTIPKPEETVVIKSYCSIDRVFRMLGYDCSNMNLDKVPQTAKTSLEVNWIYLFCSGSINLKQKHPRKRIFIAFYHNRWKCTFYLNCSCI